MHETAGLTKQQIGEIVAKTNHYVKLAAAVYAVKLDLPDIRFDIKGAVWGYYVRHGQQRWIRYNPSLFCKYYASGLNETVPHEVAHYAVDSLFPKRRCKPHGVEWKAVMHEFGIASPRATASYDTSGLDVRRQHRYDYSCGCRQHQLTSTRHNRILRGQHYLCRGCGEVLNAVSKGILK